MEILAKPYKTSVTECSLNTLPNDYKVKTTLDMFVMKRKKKTCMYLHHNANKIINPGIQITG